MRTIDTLKHDNKTVTWTDQGDTWREDVGKAAENVLRQQFGQDVKITHKVDGTKHTMTVK